MLPQSSVRVAGRVPTIDGPGARRPRSVVPRAVVSIATMVPADIVLVDRQPDRNAELATPGPVEFGRRRSRCPWRIRVRQCASQLLQAGIAGLCRADATR